MRYLASMYLASVYLALCATASGACEIRWPDPEISVPQRVMAFIETECRQAHGPASLVLNQCIQSERYGYRAVVEMLSDVTTGERAARRYRICSGGLGSLGGRFHRRKADCIGIPMQIKWRFAFAQKADVKRGTRIVDADY